MLSAGFNTLQSERVSLLSASPCKTVPVLNSNNQGPQLCTWRGVPSAHEKACETTGLVPHSAGHTGSAEEASSRWPQFPLPVL